MNGENGNNINSTVKSCYATGNVSAELDGVGGVVGVNFHSTIENCYATGNVSGVNDRVGGVVGGNSLNSMVENCYATGDVSGTYVGGGVVGDNNSQVTVKNCVALNQNINISASAPPPNTVGRVCGGGSGTMTNNYGRSDMKKNNSTPSPAWTSNKDGKDGANIISTDWNNINWWTGTANFNGTTVWNIVNSQLPTLKNMPDEVKNPQNPTVK